MRALLLSLLFAAAAHGQDGTITGTVRDAATGESLPGANVRVEGTTLGAAADLDGRFAIRNVPLGDQSVTASFAGYRPTTTSVTVLRGAPVIVELSLRYLYVCVVCFVADLCVSGDQPAPVFARTAYTARVSRPEIVYVDKSDRCCRCEVPMEIPRFEITQRDAR